MRKVKRFFSDLWSSLNYLLNYAIRFMGLLLIVYGISILYKFFVERKGMQLTPEQMIVAYGGFIVLCVFIAAVVIASVKNLRYDKDNSEVHIDRQLDKKISNMPSLNLSIDSKDFAHMNPQQIGKYFKGIQKVYIEHRRAVKEISKLSGVQNDTTSKEATAKENSTTEKNSGETQSN